MKQEITKSTDRVMSVWQSLILAVWCISVIWLFLALVYMTYLLIQWALLKGDPLRYETAIVSAYAALFSIPAGLGVIIAGLLPRTRISIHKRVLGIALLLLCFGVTTLHDYLQAKYR